MTKLVSCYDGLIIGIWLYALFLSAVVKTGPQFRVSIICIGSIGQLHLVSAIIVFNWRATRTILRNSPFLGIITGLTNVSCSEGIGVSRFIDIE